MSFTKRFAGRYNDLPQSLKKGKTAFILSMITLPVIGFIIFYFAYMFKHFNEIFKKLCFKKDIT